MRNSWMALACLAAFLTLGAPLFAEEPIDPNASRVVTLPFANFPGITGNWETVLVLTNAGDASIDVPHFWADYPVGGPAVVIPGKGAVRFPGWPRSGAGVEDIEIPEGVDAAVELHNPNRMVFRTGTMDHAVNLGESLEWIGLQTEGGFHAPVLIGTKGEAAAIEIESFAGDESLGIVRYAIPDHGVVVPWLPYGATRATVRHGSLVGPAPVGPFWAVAWIWHAPLLECVTTVEPVHHTAD